MQEEEPEPDSEDEEAEAENPKRMRAVVIWAPLPSHRFLEQR